MASEILARWFDEATCEIQHDYFERRLAGHDVRTIQESAISQQRLARTSKFHYKLCGIQLASEPRGAPVKFG